MWALGFGRPLFAWNLWGRPKPGGGGWGLWHRSSCACNTNRRDPSASFSQNEAYSKLCCVSSLTPRHEICGCFCPFVNYICKYESPGTPVMVRLSPWLCLCTLFSSSTEENKNSHLQVSGKKEVKARASCRPHVSLLVFLESIAGVDPGFWSVKFWPQGVPDPKICAKLVVFLENCLKTAWLEKKIRGKGGPLDPRLQWLPTESVFCSLSETAFSLDLQEWV